MPFTRNSETLVAIPAFNEQNTIQDVVTGCKKYIAADVIVFDDFSTDFTSLNSIAAGASVETCKYNIGYYQILNKAFGLAIKYNYKKIIFIDADGEHNPSYLTEFDESLENNVLVLGVRNKFNRWSETASSYFSKIKWGIIDPYCGMRGYNICEIRRLKLKSSPGEQLGTAMFREIKQKHPTQKLVQIPIRVNKRADQSRFGANLKIEFELIKNILV